jgi:tight adherence protein B
MSELLLPILAALSVGLGSFAIINLIADRDSVDRRKIKKRLSDKRPTENTRIEARSLRNDIPRDGLEGWILQFRPFRRIDDMVVASAPELGLKKFLAISIGAAVSLAMIMLAVTMVPIVALVSGVLGAVIPLLVLVKKRINRQKLLDDQLPDAMDFLGRALRAGHSLSSGLQMMGNELPKPIAGEFAYAYAQHSLGIAMDVVLKDMTRRIDSTDFSFFITSVLIQRQTGGDLSEVLNNISGMIRQRVRLQQQVKAKTAEGRFTGYLLTAFPAVMFVILYVIKPDYAAKLTDTTLGNQLLVFGLVMQCCGLFAINKITKVRV